MSLDAIIFSARLHAAEQFEQRDVPSAAIVAAVISHESRGQAHKCLDEKDGSSSRGLMMVNRKHSRCCAEDDARFAADYDPRRNVRYGVWLLAFQSRWHREKGHTGHPSLVHYAGRGPAAERFAKEIIEMAATIEAEGRP